MHLHGQRSKLDHFPGSDLFAHLQKGACEALRECNEQPVSEIGNMVSIIARLMLSMRDSTSDTINQTDQSRK